MMRRFLGASRALVVVLATAALIVAGLGSGVATARPGPHPVRPSAAKQPWEPPPPKVTITRPRPRTVTPATPPAAPRAATPNATTSPVPVIIDTDIYGSADDAGALAIANAMQDNGQLTILGEVVDYPSRWGAPAADAINTYYGHGNIPVGSIQPVTDDVSNPDYAQYLAQNYPNTVQDGANAPEAVALYRQLLAGAADGSVVIVAIGLETNLANLLASPPDDYSPLGGRDLVAQKVRLVSMMGGQYPNSIDHGEFNWVADSASAQAVVNDTGTGWPTPIEYSGYEVGQNIMTGAGLGQTPDTNPVRAAFERMIGPGTSMGSWDQTAVYYAGLGLNGMFTDGPAGECVVDANGGNYWQSSSTRADHYLVEAASPDTIAADLEGLMDQLPVGP